MKQLLPLSIVAAGWFFGRWIGLAAAAAAVWFIPSLRKQLLHGIE